MSRIWHGKLVVDGVRKNLSGIYVGESGKVVKRYSRKIIFADNASVALDNHMLLSTAIHTSHSHILERDGSDGSQVLLRVDGKGKDVADILTLRLPRGTYLKKIHLETRTNKNDNISIHLITKEGNEEIISMVDGEEFHYVDIDAKKYVLNADGEFEIPIWMIPNGSSALIQIWRLYAVKG